MTRSPLPLLLPLLCGCALFDFGRLDGGNSPSVPLTLTPTEPLKVELQGGDALYARFTLTEPAWITLSTADSDIDTVLDLRDDTGRLLHQDDDSGPDATARVESPLPPGAYFVEARGYHDTPGDLDLELQLTPLRDLPALPHNTPLTQDLDEYERLLATVEVDHDGRYRIDSHGSQVFDTVLDLYALDGTLLERNDDTYLGATARIDRDLTAGIYVVALRCFGDDEGVVRLTWTERAGPQTPVLQLGTPQSNQIPPSGQLWRRVELPADGMLRATATGDLRSPQLRLLNDALDPLAESRPQSPGVVMVESWLAAGTYFVELHAPLDAGENLTLLAETPPATPGAHPSVPHDLAVGIPVEGELQPGESFWAQLQLHQTTSLELTVEGFSGLDTRLALHDGVLNELAEDDDSGPGRDPFVARDLYPGRYLIKVSSYQSGRFRLSARRAPPGSQPSQPADLQPGNPLQFVARSRSYWAQFTVAQPSMCLLQTRDAAFDTVLRLHDSVQNVLATDDDSGPGRHSRIRQPLRPGTYLVEVSSFGSGAGAATLDLDLQSFNGPNGLQTITAGSSLSGTLQPGEQTLVRFDVARPLLARFDTHGSDLDTTLRVYDDQFQELGFNDDHRGPTSEVELQLTPGAVFLEVGAHGGPGQWRLRAETPNQPGSLNAPYDLALGTPRAGTLPDRTSVWGRITVSQTDFIDIHSQDSSFDTVLRLHDAQLNLIQEDDDGGPDRTSRIERPLAPATYYVELTGYGGAGGSFNLTAVAKSQQLAGSALLQDGVPTRGAFSTSMSQVWFRCDLADGRYTFDTNGSGFDTTLGLYDAQFTLLEEDDDDGVNRCSLIARDLPAGTYYLRLGSYGGSASGPYVVTYQQTGATLAANPNPTPGRPPTRPPTRPPVRPPTRPPTPPPPPVPVIHEVEPRELTLIRDGAEIQLKGEELTEERTYRVGGQEVAVRSVEAGARVSLQLPADFPIGLHRVEVTGPQGWVQASQALVVRRITFDDKELLGLTLRSVPPGEGRLGQSTEGPGQSTKADPHADLSQEPLRTWEAPEGLWIGRHEVTWGTWREVMGEVPDGVSDAAPVSSVSFTDAQAFCVALTERAAADPDWAGWTFRLPTEAEWEYCARGGTRTPIAVPSQATNRRPFASRLARQAWFQSHCPQGIKQGPFEVGQLEPNPWGLYDVHGNVGEWCLPDPELPEPPADHAPFRGGSWTSEYRGCRSSQRDLLPADFASASTGFRVIAEAP